MTRRFLLAAALVAIPLAAATAQSGLTAEQIVAARQSAYFLSGATFAEMKAVADNPASDIHTLVFPARALARWARTLPTMFPAGTNLPSSHALPPVWTDRAGFEAKAAAYAAAAQALAQAAQTGDRAAFLTQWAAVRQTCSDCHDTYKSSN